MTKPKKPKKKVPTSVAVRIVVGVNSQGKASVGLIETGTSEADTKKRHEWAMDDVRGDLAEREAGAIQLHVVSVTLPVPKEIVSEAEGKVEESLDPEKPEA